MTDINKKSLFALFATALMVFSSCALIVSCTDSNSEVNSETSATPIRIVYDNSNNKWVMSGAPSTGIQLNGNKLSLDNLDFECTNAEKSSYVMMISDTTSSATTPREFIIEYNGNNRLIHNPSTPNTVDYSYGILITNVNLKIQGVDTTSKLTVESGNAVNLSIGIGGTESQNEKSVINFVNGDVTVNAKMGGLNTYALRAKGDVTFSNSTTSLFPMGATNNSGIDCAKVSISNQSNVNIISSACTMVACGIDTKEFSISDSQLTVTANAADASVGIDAEKAPTDGAVKNSSMTIVGQSYAIKDKPETWNTSKFVNEITSVSTKADGSNPQYIYGNITSQYKCVKTVPGTPPAAYTVTYDINGGNGTTPPSETYVVGNDGITLPDSSGFTKDGSTFKGWSADNGKTVMKAGEKYKPSSNVTLKAIWEQNSSGGNDNTTIIICAVLAIIILVGAGAYAYFKKFKQ